MNNEKQLKWIENYTGKKWRHYPRHIKKLAAKMAKFDNGLEPNGYPHEYVLPLHKYRGRSRRIKRKKVKYQTKQGLLRVIFLMQLIILAGVAYLIIGG